MAAVAPSCFILIASCRFVYQFGFDIDYAGKRVIVPISPSSTSSSIVIVQNWYETFRDQPR